MSNKIFLAISTHSYPYTKGEKVVTRIYSIYDNCTKDNIPLFIGNIKVVEREDLNVELAVYQFLKDEGHILPHVSKRIEELGDLTAADFRIIFPQGFKAL